MPTRVVAEDAAVVVDRLAFRSSARVVAVVEEEAEVVAAADKARYSSPAPTWCG